MPVTYFTPTQPLTPRLRASARPRTAHSPRKRRPVQAYAQHRRLEAYVVESGCLQLVEDLLQHTLLERPTELLPFLVCASRPSGVAGYYALYPKPTSWAQLQPTAFERRQAWGEFVDTGGVRELLERLVREMLQAQPASPRAYCTQWLEHECELTGVPVPEVVEMPEVQASAAPPVRPPSAPVRKLAPGGLQPVEPSGLAPDLEPAADAVTDEVAALQLKLEQGQILSVGEMRMLRQSAYEQKLQQGQMLTATEMLELRKLVADAEADSAGAGGGGLVEGAEEEDDSAAAIAALEAKLADGLMLSEEEWEELRWHALEEKLEQGQMLSTEEMDMMRCATLLAMHGPQSPAPRPGLTRPGLTPAAESGAHRWRAIETKLASGQMLTAAEQQLLRVRAVEENLARGHMLSADEANLLRQHARGYALSPRAGGGGAGGEAAVANAAGKEEVMLNDLVAIAEEAIEEGDEPGESSPTPTPTPPSGRPMTAAPKSPSAPAAVVGQRPASAAAPTTTPLGGGDGEFLEVDAGAPQVSDYEAIGAGGV